MTQSILTLAPATAAFPTSTPVLPAPPAGLLTAANAATPLPFVDVFRALGLASTAAETAAMPPLVDAEAGASEVPPTDVSLPSQSALPAALHAGSGVTGREAETDELPSGEAMNMPIAAPTVPLPLPAQTQQVAPAAARRGEVAPVAVAGGKSVAPQLLPVDGPDAEVVAAAQPLPQSAHGALPTTSQSTPVATETVLKLAPASPQSWQQPLTDALGDRLQLQSVQQGERAVIRLDPPTLGRIEIIVHQDAGGALQVHLSASNGEVLRQLHAIGDSLRADLGQRHAQGDVTVVVAESGRDANGRDADGRSRSGQQQQSRDDDNPGDALAEAQAGAGTSRFALTTDGS